MFMMELVCGSVQNKSSGEQWCINCVLNDANVHLDASVHDGASVCDGAYVRPRCKCA